ncbi:MAG: hypothetical protein KBG15_20020, partial [Kofleriaceae bacterium]|nr:hypothetical protein [Kofleriaceae bacterium]
MRHLTSGQLVLWLSLLAAACGAEGASENDANPTTDGGFPDARPTCLVNVTFTPSQAQASAGTVRAQASVFGAAGIVEYQWQVSANGRVVPTARAQPDGSEVTFAIDQPGVYQAIVQITSGTFCPSGTGYLNVSAANANTAPFRLRFTAPLAAGVPVQDRVVMVAGGADYFAGPVSLERGVDANATLVSGGVPQAAFVRIASTGTSAPIAVETYSSADGTISLPLQFGMYDVLITPLSDVIAPLRLAWDTLATTIDVTPGTIVTGHVFAPNNTPMANARVALRVGNLPSTIGITDSTGGFSVRARPSGGAVTEIRVAPSNGLPTLVASAAFDLSTDVVVRYNAGIGVRNLQGLEVRDAGNGLLPFTQVAVRGEQASAGTVTAGVASVARAVAVASATTDNTGRMPTLMVPTFALAAAIAPPMGATGLVAVPTVTPAQLRAAPTAMLSATVTLASVPLAGVELRLTPTSASPLAALPPVQLSAITDAAGGAAIAVAGAARFNVRVVDPQRRMAPLERLDVAVGALGM